MTRGRESLVLAAVVSVLTVCGAGAQKRVTIEGFLSPGYPYELVAAKKADRIAWIANERGRRNVYTATAPDFGPVRLTNYLEDDGTDLTSLRISDDGSIVVFVRGHRPNRDGWIANPSSDPRGAERAIWAARTSGGEAWKLAVASSPVLAPNGRWVLFTRDNQTHGVPVDPALATTTDVSEKPLFLAFGENGRPSWSPDSKKIAFVSNRGDHSFIGVYDLESSRVTYIAPSVDRDSSPTWSPEGRRIAFVRRPGLPFGRQASARGSGFRGRREFRRRGARPVEARAGGARRPDVPGLTRASFKGGHTMSMWVADVATGKGREFWHNPPEDSAFAAIRGIQWAGDHVLFSVERDNWRHYYSVSVTGESTEPVDLTPGQGLAEHIGTSSDGRYLYYSTNVGDIDRRHVWRTPTNGGRAVQITKGDMIETYPAPLASGNKIAILNAGAKQPQSVALVSAESGSVRVIYPELANGFPVDVHVVPQNVVLTADDGLQFHNQVFVPKDLREGERRPAILFTHGGPRRQMLLGYHYRHFYHMAYAVNQYFASQGYVVISVNYRSGIGYGRRFRNAENRGSRGNAEYQDVLAAGKYLQSRPDVDPERIGLWGLSYGGLLTAQGLARNSDIFAAGVDLAGVHLWGSSIDVESTSYKSSPISEIEKWTSPVLLIHGDDDRNVAFSQTTGLVQLLRANDVYHELIVFPDEVHSFLRHGNWLTALNAMDDFFQRFLKKKG